MLTERLDLLALTIDFARIDAELVAAEQYRDLIASTTKALADIATAGPITSELADSIEATVRRFDAACGQPVLIEVSAPEPNIRIVRALQAGERAYEASRDRIGKIIEAWEPHVIALGQAAKVELDAATPLARRYVVSAMIAGLDLGGPDAIENVRRFARFLLDQPLDGSAHRSVEQPAEPAHA